MTEKLVILGSTGSIGVQALEVCRNLGVRVEALTANRNIGLLERQAREFRPKLVAVGDENYGNDLKIKLSDTGTVVVSGRDGLIDAVSQGSADTVLTSVVGIAGLEPTMAAIKSKKKIALANKETLVTAGQLVINEAKSSGVSIIPVDSEHSAIFQSIGSNSYESIHKLILTASGGPFRGYTPEQLKRVNVSEALNHPNWSMGNKITIDSATLMNKGLEVIEAKWLFDVEPEQIQVLVHPQSIIHSMVEYVDGSILAQLGAPDMKIPIQFALTHPMRKPNSFNRADLLKMNSLTFEAPDFNTFPCLQYAYDVLKIGGTMPVVLNAANEIAVDLFLRGRIPFTGIMKCIEKAMAQHRVNNNPSLLDIIEVDRMVRERVTVDG